MHRPLEVHRRIYLPRIDLGAGLAVFVTAVAARLAVLPHATADGGDAASRVWIAADWLADPRVITHGVWGPLHTYLIALSLALVPDPVHAPVALSLGLSAAAAVAMYWFVVAELDDRRAALLVALTYAVYPIAVRNGVSVRSESPFSLFVLLAMVALARARRDDGSWYHAAGAGIALTLATMLRYEGWLLVPFMGALLLRKPALLGVFVACAGIHPLLWMIGNTAHSGDPFYSMNWASRWELEAMGRSGAKRAALAASALQYPGTIIRGMTWPLGALALTGALRALWTRHRLRIWLLPAGALVAAWMLAIARGALVPKLNYTESAGVLLLPFSGLVYAGMGVRQWSAIRVVGAALVLVATVVVFSCRSCLDRVGLGRLAGISPVPTIDNQSIALGLLPVLMRELGTTHAALVTDHFGWGATYYVALQTRLPRARIFLAPGAPNQRLDADSLSRFLGRHRRGVLISLAGSRFSTALGIGAGAEAGAGDTASVKGHALRLEPVHSVHWPGKRGGQLTVFRYSYSDHSPSNATTRANAASPPLNFQGKQPSASRRF